MTVSDEQIGAWLDGALDEAEAARIAEQVSRDPQLALRAERLGEVDRLLRQAIPLDEALPGELMARLGLAAPATPAEEPSNVVSLAGARAGRAGGAAPRKAYGQVWRIAAQVVLVVGLGLGAAVAIGPTHRAPDEAPYTALGDKAVPGPAANALIAFAPGTDEAAARRIAGAHGANLVARTSAGAWRATVAPGRRARILAELRRIPAVTLAEPIEGAPQ